MVNTVCSNISGHQTEWNSTIYHWNWSEFDILSLFGILARLWLPQVSVHKLDIRWESKDSWKLKAEPGSVDDQKDNNIINEAMAELQIEQFNYGPCK